MASVSTVPERELREKIRAYDRLFVKYSEASFDAARTRDAELQILYVQTALACAASSHQAQEELATLQGGEKPLRGAACRRWQFPTSSNVGLCLTRPCARPPPLPLRPQHLCTSPVIRQKQAVQPDSRSPQAAWWEPVLTAAAGGTGADASRMHLPASQQRQPAATPGKDLVFVKVRDVVNGLEKDYVLGL